MKKNKWPAVLARILVGYWTSFCRKKHFALNILLLCVGLLLCSCLDITHENVNRSNAVFAKGPYLLYTGDNTSMKVLWQADSTPGLSFIQWGYTPVYTNWVMVNENGSSEHMHQFSHTIAGLTPSTRIFYKVTIDNNSYTGSFMSAPPDSATSLSFYASGDTRSLFDFPPEAHNDVLRAILNDCNAAPNNRQTFVLNSGDLTMYGLGEESWTKDYFYRDYDDILRFYSRFPSLIAIGNHEAYPMYSFTVDHANADKLLRKYFPYGFLADANRYYYSFDCGPVHFLVLDQYTLLDGVAGRTYAWEAENDAGQFAWMKEDLQNTDKPWKVVMFHQPAWTAKKEMGFSGNDVIMRDWYCPIFEQEGVDVVIQGHVHFYSRCVSEGIQYLTLGGGGAELSDEVETDAPGFVAGSSHVYHFARFDVADDNTLDVTVINKDGGVIDSFTVTH